MENNKKNVIVTLADSNFIAQAKQLFSSVYHNAGWTGDYLLLAQGFSLSDKAWFEERGVSIYECEALSENLVGFSKYPPVILSKLYLFKEYFKRWDKVVFLDADMIVRGSLGGLLKVKKFAAVWAGIPLRSEFSETDRPLLRKLKKSYLLMGKAFNSGVFAFDTSIISPHTFSDLLLLYREFGQISSCGEESILNLFFKNKWQGLPIIYNSVPNKMQSVYNISQEELKAVAIHFAVDLKPWNADSAYYEEWQKNLQKAEEIDLTKPQPAQEVFAVGELKGYLRGIKRRDLLDSYATFLRFCDYLVGQFGLFLRRRKLAVYKLIRLNKDVK